METQTKPMTGKEKLRRLLEVKRQAEQEARNFYQTDSKIQEMVGRLRLKTAKEFGK